MTPGFPGLVFKDLGVLEGPRGSSKGSPARGLLVLLGGPVFFWWVQIITGIDISKYLTWHDDAPIHVDTRRLVVVRVCAEKHLDVRRSADTPDEILDRPGWISLPYGRYQTNVLHIWRQHPCQRCTCDKVFAIRRLQAKPSYWQNFIGAWLVPNLVHIEPLSGGRYQPYGAGSSDTQRGRQPETLVACTEIATV